MIDLSTVVEVRYSDREGVPAFSFDLLTDARIFTLASTTASESDVVPELQRTAVPLIVPALGDGFTVTTRVAVAVPQLFETV